MHQPPGVCGHIWGVQRTGSRDPWDKGGSLHWEVSKPDLIQGRPPALEFLSGRKSGWAAAGKGHLSPVSGVHGSLFTPEKWSMNQGQELQTETQTGPQGRLKFRAMQLSRHSTILNPLERMRHWADHVRVSIIMLKNLPEEFLFIIIAAFCFSEKGSEQSY